MVLDCQKAAELKDSPELRAVGLTTTTRPDGHMAVSINFRGVSYGPLVLAPGFRNLVLHRLSNRGPYFRDLQRR